MQRFSNILLIADVSLEKSAALRRAIELAVNSQASLTIIDIVDEFPTDLQMAVTAKTSVELSGIVTAEKREQLERAVSAATNKGIEVNAKVLVGKPFLEIIRQVLRHDHDVVIKCVEPTTNLKGMLYGSSDMHLLRKCPCPVWITKSADHDHYGRILAAVDRDPEDTRKDDLNQPILEMATSLALAESSELHIVHAWDLYGESFLRSPRTNYTDADVDAMLAEEERERRMWLEQLVAEHSVAVGKEAVDYAMPQLHLVKGHARHVVPMKVRDLHADLIVMGTVARTGIPGFFMGNTAESILSQIDCSVLAIKPSGFVSPVSI